MTAHVRDYWQGKSVLITGASSGLGRAVAAALAPFGVRLGLLSRRLEKMQELAEQLKDSGSTFFCQACDVRDREQVYAAVNAFHKEAGGLDVGWVNSGISLNSSFEDWDWQGYADLIDTNLNGAIYTIRACLEIMVPRKSGTIVGIGSAASMRGLPSRGVYSFSKVALDYFLESLAVELPAIQFTTIHPGFVDTPINQGNPNRFWLLTPEQAAQIMIKAVAKKRRVVIYPWRMNLLFRLVRALPRWVYEPLARKGMAKSRPAEHQRMAGAAEPN
ncbi:MAG: SDR family NAD(P)-dependent oxidoreductase [Calditrichaeota bacterium]|nr:MAG: SDR family NAD(P)-dependent oxidoreductase [Calditrichota bacterium]